MTTLFLILLAIMLAPFLAGALFGCIFRLRAQPEPKQFSEACNRPSLVAGGTIVPGPTWQAREISMPPTKPMFPVSVLTDHPLSPGRRDEAQQSNTKRHSLGPKPVQRTAAAGSTNLSAWRNKTRQAQQFV